MFKIQAKWYGGMGGRWSLWVQSTNHQVGGSEITISLYYKTIKAGDFGIGCPQSWSHGTQKLVSGEKILGICKGRKGNLQDLADFVHKNRTIYRTKGGVSIFT